MATINTTKPTNLQPTFPGFPGSAVAVTLGEDVTFTAPVTLWVGTAGDVTVLPANGGSAVTFKEVPAGACIPLRVIGIVNATTDAADLVAIY